MVSAESKSEACDCIRTYSNVFFSTVTLQTGDTGTPFAKPNRTQPHGSYGLYWGMPWYATWVQDRDLTALRRAARRLADSNESGELLRAGGADAAGESKVHKVDKVDTFRRCILTYPEEMMFCMVKVTKNHQLTV